MTDSAVEAEELAVLLAWIESYSASSEQLKEQTAAAAYELWSNFRGWYDTDAVNALAAQVAALSTISQQYAAGSTMEYVAGIAAVTGATSAAAGSVPVGAPLDALAIIRNAIPLSLVHTRPSEVYKRAIALGYTTERATGLALARAQNLIITDLTLQEREVELEMLQRLGITHYRRIIHPELSRTGTCGLCIAAASRKYSTGELMPIHPPSCKCTVMPIVGDHDPGDMLNQQSIDDLYKLVARESNSTGKSDLSHIRVAYQVNEHGEYGPVLSKVNDHFRDPTKVALEDDPDRAARMLAKAAPVLAQMEADPGVDPEALAYQRALYDRLRAIVPDDFDTA